jgi:L-ascorbate metabolism protein UlaG (beta-lactamase superfamily)
MLQGIHWVGHASFRIEAESVVYIDPWRVQNPVPADLVLITHGHHDHLSAEDLAKIAKPDTVYVVARPYAKELSGDVRSMAVGDTLAVRGITIEAVASHNTNKPNHPKKAGNVGYVLTIGGRRIYHAGDTDVIPEMADIRCDVALLPVGGKYTMDAQEAIEAVKMIRPQVVVPMHWGAIVGSATEPQILADGVPTGVQVVTLTAEG